MNLLLEVILDALHAKYEQHFPSKLGLCLPVCHMHHARGMRKLPLYRCLPLHFILCPSKYLQENRNHPKHFEQREFITGDLLHEWWIIWQAMQGLVTASDNATLRARRTRRANGVAKLQKAWAARSRPAEGGAVQQQLKWWRRCYSEQR